jgi:peptidoglycan hydrolase-like amidase
MIFKSSALRKKIRRFLKYLLILTILTQLSGWLPWLPSHLPKSQLAQARTLGSIEEDIDKKSQELDELQKQLDEAEKDLNAKRTKESQAKSEVDKLKAEIETINATLKFNQLKLDELAEAKKLKEFEKEESEKRQDLQVNTAYLSWKSKKELNSLFGGADIVKNSIYNEALYTKNHGGILGIATELKSIEEQYEKYKTDSDDLQTEIGTLERKKAEAQAKLDELARKSSQASQDVSSIRSEASKLQSQIDQLTKEQQEQQQKEEDTVRTNPGGATRDLVEGEFYFTGQGRDLYQGHGIGMSQYGALGAALQGWDYKKIVQFYFKGTQVGTVGNLPGSINVDGVGHVPTEDYVAGLGEVPDKSCEQLGVNFNPNNIWHCWPAEAIKAQIVVARTYGARRAGFIYRDARAQVYKGGTAKKWAADATKSQVVVSGGGLANVYYSSDNNQGKGTANNDTVWSNYSGDATPIPYLQSVNDNSFAYKTKWTTWTWRTNSYSQKDFNDFLNWSATSGSVSSSTRSFMSNVKNDIGMLTSFSFERDPSGRVKKIVFKGDKGTRKIAGWLYKSCWNIWVGTVKPKGESDYIYSLTYYLNLK